MDERNTNNTLINDIMKHTKKVKGKLKGSSNSTKKNEAQAVKHMSVHHSENEWERKHIGKGAATARDFFTFKVES